jgi:hypothetical protein
VIARQTTPQVVVLLLVLGASCVAVRTRFRHNTPLSPGESTWRLSYEVGLHARKAGAILHAAYPEGTQRCRIMEHRFVAPGMTEEVHRPSYAKTDVKARAMKAGQLTARVEFDILLSERARWRPDRREAKPTTDERVKYLQDEKMIQASDPVVRAALDDLREGLANKDELVEKLFEHCYQDIVAGRENDPRDAVGALTKKVATSLGRARAMVALCRAAKIPARLVTGFELKIGSPVRPHTWVEVFANNSWEPYDPEYGFSRDLPHHYLPVRRDGVQIVHTSKDATGLTPTFSIVRLPPPAGTFGLDRHNPVNMLDLMRLPAKLHEVMSLILLMPLGALVTALFRTIIGLRTFGTFTPTLLALSFVYNDWRMGLIVFVGVLIVGFTSRTLLDRLKLLLVPRLGIILTLVVLCMVFSVSVFNYFSFTLSGETVLLPMVILTMLIERFYVTTEEDSMRFAVQLLLGTIVLAFIVYLLLRWKTVGHMMLIYPELHCFTIAALVLIGRYTGYRLTELWRFRDLAERE